MPAPSIRYIPRVMSHAISEASRYFPVVTVTGPRQSGKSTLLRHMFPEMPYRSMENIDTRNYAREDPRGFFNSFPAGLIIDEVQNLPELLSYLQGIVDERRGRRYFLTGSSQFSMIRSVTQSLAGRTALFELLPLSMGEVGSLAAEQSLDALLYGGFYPAIWNGSNIPGMLYRNYVKTYLERDVRDMLAIKDLDKFQRFIRLCAVRIGSIFNASELANEVGVSVNTISSWMSVLQASYIVFLLPPFFANVRKRLTKSPKIYFTDVGLASYLLEIDSPAIMGRDKMRGHLFENFVVMEALKSRFNAGKDSNLYFYRDSNGNEVDLLLKNGGKYDCIEIKSSGTYHPDFQRGIRNFASTFQDLVGEQAIIYAGDEEIPHSDVKLLNYRNIDEFMQICNGTANLHK